MSTSKEICTAIRERSLIPALLCSIFFSFAPGCASVHGTPQETPALGWLEQVRVHPPGIILHAKLDTGADNCSVHAEKIDYFKKAKEPWVNFEISNRYGDREKLSRKIIRVAKIKKKAGGHQKRPVVRLGLCLAGRFEVVECNLVDRSHFSYPVLIGRNYLAGTFNVTSTETYTQNPTCKANRFIGE